MTYNMDDISKFRKIGSCGLVVFERDGTLLKKNRSKDLTLGDFNRSLISFLRRLRSWGVRFGFFSDDRGMDAAIGGQAAASALAALIDTILRVDNIEPDFWMAMPFSIQTNSRTAQRQERLPSMLSYATEWYGIEMRKVVFVCNSSTYAQTADASGVSTLFYSATSIPAGDPGTADPLQIQRLEKLVKAALDLPPDRKHP